MTNNTAVVFVNGDFENSIRIQEVVLNSDFIVAVDGGLSIVKKLGLTPHTIIGDLDSVDKQELTYYENKDVIIQKYPVEKEETDLELAIQKIIELGFDRIWLLGATGGRVDHFLGNLYLCSNPSFMDKDIRILTHNSEMFFCKKNQEINGEPGERISLIPISEQVTGITTHGLKYPLKNEILIRWKSRGISNLMIEPIVRIRYKSGNLLCVHSFYNSE